MRARREAAGGAERAGGIREGIPPGLVPRLHQALLDAASAAEVAAAAARGLLAGTGASGALVLLRRPEGLEALARAGEAPAGAAARAEALAERALLEGARDDERLAALPLVGPGGAFGALVLAWDAPRALAPPERALLEAAAALVAQALWRASAADDALAARAELEDFVDTTTIGLHWVGPDGTILWANAADHEALGYARDEYVGRNIREFHVDEDHIGAILGTLLAGGRIIDRRARLRHKDGSVRHVLIDSSSLFRDGRFVHTRCFTRDITESVRAAEELERARRRLAMSEKFGALGQLVSGVAHEIRTPLTIIASNAALLERRARRASETGEHAPLSQELPRAVADIMDGVRRAEGLVRHLQRFTRHEAEASGPVDVAHAARDAVDLFRAAHRGTARIDVAIRPTPPVVGDAGKLQQVVINLLENAVEASRAPAEPVGLDIGHDEARGVVVLRVQDRGVGIPPEVQARMFEPLFTTRRNGTGLGLSIVRRIVEEHRGSIACESVVGVGTTFTIELPAAPRE
ncbi:MAG TPA: ATP-binding protein [Candidatus Thermoplasmatota archaeon]|nr:ATP-binding protein [Candidatus Thermoplasmatota archaeon]